MPGQKNLSQADEPLFKKVWLSLLIAILLCILFAGLWWILKKQEEANRRKAIAVEAQKALDIIHVDINNRIQSLQRMVNRWEIRGGTPEQEFISDAQAHLADDPGYQAIEWVDESFQVRWIIPLAGNESAQDLNLAFEEHRRIALEVARERRQPRMSSPIDLVQGGKGFLICSPIYVLGKFDGLVLAGFRTQKWLEHLLRPEKTQGEADNYLARVSIDGEQVFKDEEWDNQEESHRHVTPA